MMLEAPLFPCYDVVPAENALVPRYLEGGVFKCFKLSSTPNNAPTPFTSLIEKVYDRETQEENVRKFQDVCDVVVKLLVKTFREGGAATFYGDILPSVVHVFMYHCCGKKLLKIHFSLSWYNILPGD